MLIKTERQLTSEGEGEPESIHEKHDAHVEKENPGGVPTSRHQRLFRTIETWIKKTAKTDRKENEKNYL